MALLIDSSVWVDFYRGRSSTELKELIRPFIASPDAAVTEPIVFEMLRQATAAERSVLEAQFAVVALLPVQPTLWEDATELGRKCRAKGVTAGALGLLIAAVAAHHEAVIVTFDGDQERIGRACQIDVRLLRHPD